MASTFSVYTDVEDVLTNGTMQIETASLVGGHSTLGSACVAGATSLAAVSGAGAGFAGTFQLWILDGPNSEAIAGCTVSTNTITVPSPGTTYAHAAGVSLSSPGTAGTLAAIIRSASADVDTFCKQGPDGGSERTLWQKSRTETLSGPSSQRLAIDRDGTLKLHPYRFPVASVASLTLQVGAQTASTIDLTYLVLADNAELIRIPSAQTLGTPPPTTNWMLSRFPRSVGLYATLTYTAGPIVGSTLDGVPGDIREATTMLVMDRLGFRQNPSGAAMVRRGDTTIEARLRGDTSGKSILRMYAEEKLGPYQRRW